MTYLQFHLVLILPPIAILTWLYLKTARRGVQRPAFRWIWVVAGIALVYTTLWDNYLIYRGIWYYGLDRVIGTIGYVPVEEYLFFLLQPVMTGLFLYLLLAKRKQPVVEYTSASRWAGAVLYLCLAGIGVLHFRHEAGLYMGLILVWACPVLAGQWAYAGQWIWVERRTWFWGTLIPTLYLWIADRIALERGIWTISETYTTGWHLFGLPLEEATFFLLTNLLVVQGLFLFLSGGQSPDAAAS